MAGLSAALYLEWSATAQPTAVCQLVRDSVRAYEAEFGEHGGDGGGEPVAEEEEVVRGRALARMVSLLAQEWADGAERCSRC